MTTEPMNRRWLVTRDGELATLHRNAKEAESAAIDLCDRWPHAEIGVELLPQPRDGGRKL